MRRRHLQIATIVLSCSVVLAASSALLSYASWVRDISSGNDALARGDLDAAGKTFRSAASRMTGVPFASTLMPGIRKSLLFNQSQILYTSHKDDELAHLLETEAAREPSLAEESQYQFWMGNV